MDEKPPVYTAQAPPPAVGYTAQPQPGYPQPAVYTNQQPGAPGYPPQHVVQPAATTTVITTQKEPSAMRQAIPELPMPLAIVLLIVNILLPGIGTIIAGFSVFCCGNIGESGGSKFGTFCINFWVGLLQLLTCWIFFIGWIWSILWGIAFVTLAGMKGSKKTTTVVTHQQATHVTTISQGATNPTYVPA